MRAIEWSPGLMRRSGLRRLFWDAGAQQTTTNPRCPRELSGQLPSAWQLILPPKTLEGDCVSFPRTRGMWQYSHFRLRVMIRTAPLDSGGQDVLLFGLDDLLTMELAPPWHRPARAKTWSYPCRPGHPASRPYGSSTVCTRVGP